MKSLAIGLAWLLVTAFCSLGAEPANSLFALAIVPNEYYPQKGTRNMWMDREFFVVLTNVSDKPQRIFEDWSSWGNFLLSFQFITVAGKITAFEKIGPTEWTRNFPAEFEIPAGGHYVWRVAWNDKNWPNLRKLLDKWPELMVIKAVFEEPGKHPNEESNVWKGHVESKPEAFKLVWD